MCFLRKWRLTGLLFCTGACGATQFSYSINCQAVAIGQDTVDAYTQSGTIDLTPNVPNTSNTIDFFNGNTDMLKANAPSTATLMCSFTLGSVTTQVNRPFSYNDVSGPVDNPTIQHRIHIYDFQPLSFTVNLPSVGSVSVSQGERITQLSVDVPPPPGLATKIIAPSSSTLVFTPFGSVSQVPLPPSLWLILTGLAGVAVYRISSGSKCGKAYPAV